MLLYSTLSKARDDLQQSKPLTAKSTIAQAKVWVNNVSKAFFQNQNFNPTVVDLAGYGAPPGAPDKVQVRTVSSRTPCSWIRLIHVLIDCRSELPMTRSMLHSS